MIFRILLCCGFAALVTGCSAGNDIELGRVNGHVTLDGKPLADAVVEFQPANGRASIGTTDSSGYYELQYTLDRDGAIPGEHTVRITTERYASGGEGSSPLVEARKELLPARYNVESELKETVEDGSQEINFELESAS